MVVVSVSVVARETGSDYCGNGEIDHVSTGPGRMTRLLADDAVSLMVMVEKARDSVASAMVTCSGNVSVGEMLQRMYTTGETGEETMEATIEDALEISAAKTATARTGMGTEGAKTADAEIEGARTEDVRSD